MKTIFTLTIVALIAISCKSSTPFTKSEKMNEPAENQNEMSITYTAISRGTYEYISISKDSIRISNDRNLKAINVFVVSSSDWKSITTSLQGIDLNTISKLKAPTDKRLYDGAPIAVLTIKNNEKDYSTNGFDHGFPPKEIEAVVNKMISIKKALEKN